MHLLQTLPSFMIVLLVAGAFVAGLAVGCLLGMAIARDNSRG